MSNENNNMDDILKRLEAVEKALRGVTRKYQWEDNQADGGIQLAGATTVTRTGVLLAAAPVPVGPNQLSIALVLQEISSGRIAMVPVDMAKQVAD